MKRVRNLMALLLAVAMLLSASAVAFADDASYYNKEGYPICDETIDVTLAGAMPSGLENWQDVILIKNFAEDLGINITCNFYNSDD